MTKLLILLCMTAFFYKVLLYGFHFLQSIIVIEFMALIIMTSFMLSWGTNCTMVYFFLVLVVSISLGGFSLSLMVNVSRLYGKDGSFYY